MDNAETRERTRRRGSETRERTENIVFRATPSERAKYAAGAERSGLTLGSFIRGSLDAAPQTRSTRRPTMDQQAAAQMLKELHRAGANVYQITRRVNFGETPALEEIRAAIAECRAAIAACHAVLGTAAR